MFINIRCATECANKLCELIPMRYEENGFMVSSYGLARLRFFFAVIVQYRCAQTLNGHSFIICTYYMRFMAIRTFLLYIYAYLYGFYCFVDDAMSFCCPSVRIVCIYGAYESRMYKMERLVVMRKDGFADGS